MKPLLWGVVHISKLQSSLLFTREEDVQPMVSFLRLDAGNAPMRSPRAVLSKIVYWWEDESLDRQKTADEIALFYQQLCT